MPGVWKLNTAMVSVMVMGVRAGSHVHGSLCCEAAVCFACNDRAGTMHGNVSLYIPNIRIELEPYMAMYRCKYLI